MSQSVNHLQTREELAQFAAGARIYAPPAAIPAMTRSAWIDLIKGVNPHIQPHVAERLIQWLSGSAFWSPYQLILSLSVVMGDLAHREAQGTVPAHIQKRAKSSQTLIKSWDDVGTWLPDSLPSRAIRGCHS